MNYFYLLSFDIQCVPLAPEPGISLIVLPLMKILQQNFKRITDTFLFISYTTNILLFKFRCNIFIGVRIIKEMPGLVASGTHCICVCVCIYIYIYRVSQEECARLREIVPYVKVYRYNPKHLYPKLNGYGDNGQRSLKRQLLHTY